MTPATTLPVDRYEKAGKFARGYLKQTATQSIQYVALGKCLKRDLVEQYGLTETEADSQLVAIMENLVEHIQRL